MNPLAAAQAEAARLFAASLLTWLWHTARQDRLLAALCIGPGRLGVEQLASAGFRDLQRAAAGAVDCLEARFCRHPRLWPDLVRAASQRGRAGADGDATLGRPAHPHQPPLSQPTAGVQPPRFNPR